MADLRRLGLRRAMMLRVLAGSATSFDFTLQLGNALFVSAAGISLGDQAKKKRDHEKES